MKTVSFTLTFVTLALVAGARSWASPAREAGDSTFDRAWKSVVSGARKTAQAGDSVIERANDGAVIAYDTAGKTGQRAVQKVDDAAILAVVKTRYASDPSLNAGAISVSVDNGVVALTGNVRGPDEAETAIRLALQTGGVNRVVSRLVWPGMPAPHAP